jgi:hypothetical protein
LLDLKAPAAQSGLLLPVSKRARADDDEELTRRAEQRLARKP